MPAQKSAKSPKSASGTAAKAVSKTAAKAPAKAAPKKAAAAAPAPVAKKVKTVPVKSTAELIKAADELLKKKPARAKAVAAAADDEEAPKKKPGRPAKAAGAAEAKAPAKRGRKPKAAAGGDESVDDTDLSDIEADLEGEIEETPEAAATVEKVKPLRMKISKAKERALMKEFGLDETVLSEEDMAKRRARLKTLIKLGKTRGYLTHVEISDHLPDKLVDAETLEAVITTLNDLGVAVYEQTPDAEALIITDNAPAGATEEEAEEAAEAALSTLTSTINSQAHGYRAFGPILSEVVNERLRGLTGAAAAKPARINDRVTGVWQLGEGWVAHVRAALVLDTRDGKSTRGGELATLPNPAPSSASARRAVRMAAISSAVIAPVNSHDSRAGSFQPGKAWPVRRPAARRSPNSSASSRKPQSSGVSPGSAPPPGRSQCAGNGIQS